MDSDTAVQIGLAGVGVAIIAVFLWGDWSSLELDAVSDSLQATSTIEPVTASIIETSTATSATSSLPDIHLLPTPTHTHHAILAAESASRTWFGTSGSLFLFVGSLMLFIYIVILCYKIDRKYRNVTRQHEVILDKEKLVAKLQEDCDSLQRNGYTAQETITHLQNVIAAKESELQLLRGRPDISTQTPADQSDEGESSLNTLPTDTNRNSSEVTFEAPDLPNTPSSPTSLAQPPHPSEVSQPSVQPTEQFPEPSSVVNGPVAADEVPRSTHSLPSIQPIVQFPEPSSVENEPVAADELPRSTLSLPSVQSVVHFPEPPSVVNDPVAAVTGVEESTIADETATTPSDPETETQPKKKGRRRKKRAHGKANRRKAAEEEAARAAAELENEAIEAEAEAEDWEQEVRPAGEDTVPDDDEASEQEGTAADAAPAKKGRRRKTRPKSFYEKLEEYARQAEAANNAA